MAKISPHEEKMLNLRQQMQHNNTDLADFIKDLDGWEKDMKKKENKLKTEGKNLEKQASDLPPVRNTVHKKKLKKKKKEKPISSENIKPKKISGFDFKAWDKFDVDAALEEIDKEEEKNDKTSSSEYETDEEWEVERKKYLATQEKDKGNNYLKNGDYDKAIEAYSKGMQYDPTNAVLSANRAMALLKQQKFAAAEFDCTTSITLDPMYVKAYLRRAAARAGMDKMEDAIKDFNTVLDLEPSNKQAKSEIERLQKEVERSKGGHVATTLVENEVGLVKPIYKAPEERSKKPLYRVAIEEIGIESASRPKPQAEQSELSKKITEKEKAEFDKLFVSSETTNKNDLITTNCEKSKVVEISKKDENNDGMKKDNSTSDEPQSERCVKSKKAELSPRNDTAKAAEISSSTQSSIHNGSGDAFGVPQSSFQFQADFKQLKHRQEDFFQYFQAISPELYSKLFGQSFDAEILNTVLNCLALHPDQVDLYKVLYNLSQVKRFSMTAMFLSKKEKQVAADLIQSLNNSGHSESELSTLRKSYSL